VVVTVSALVMLFGIALFVACVLSGLRNLRTCLRRSRGERRPPAARGAAKLVAAALIAAVPWAAAPIAESSTGWVDTDQDGMLDGFVNGSYDWVDINGGAWAGAAAFLIVLIVSTLVAVLAALRSFERATAVERTHSAGVADWP
jgi:hypothetical protein